jgi:SAM-dependent MidA family methyltransferase
MTPLEEIIRSEIRAAGPMPFERFMELALYSPGLGYYARTDGLTPIGRHGDFFTSVSVGPLFGRLLARQFFQMWQNLGCPSPFWVMEQGAHDGQLAGDILSCCREQMPELLAALRYAIVQAPGAAKIHQKCGPEPGLLTYITWFDDLAALRHEKPVGVFFSNELVDAFPVHAILFHDGAWRESCVAINGEVFAWVDRAIENAELAAAVAELGLPRMEGYATEINLRGRVWMREVAAALQRGYVLTIDYGHSARVYYSPERTGGTLTAYVKHRSDTDVLAEPGRRDLTAHVDFTALADAGEAAGLHTLGFLDQQHFLMGVAHAELSGEPGPRAGIQENVRGWQTLTHPNHLGATFFALLQAKDAPATLDGLRFARPGGLD